MNKTFKAVKLDPEPFQSQKVQNIVLLHFRICSAVDQAVGFKSYLLFGGIYSCLQVILGVEEYFFLK